MMHLFKKCLVRLTLFFAYGLLGGWIFCLVEKRNETYSSTADRLLDKLRKTMAAKYNFTNLTDFEDFVQTVSEAVQLKSNPDWTFMSGCSFTFATLTTVGYGDITPKTSLGKGLTILYCLIGLPIAMLTLKSSGQMIVLGMKSLTVNFEKKVLKRENPQKKFVKCFALNICCQLLLIFVLAGMGMYFDGFTFFEGVYCWFVTFTTIGYGDYVPLRKYREVSIDSPWKIYGAGILIALPYITGLCLISSLLSLLVESSEKIKVRKCFYQDKQSQVNISGKSITKEENDNRPATESGVKLHSFVTNRKA